MTSFKLDKYLEDNDGFEIQYACPHCDTLFSSVSRCSEHMESCIDNVNDKRKISEGDAIKLNSLQDRKIHSDTDEPDDINNFTNYEISSEIIDENEVLITLRYKGDNEEDAVEETDNNTLTDNTVPNEPINSFDLSHSGAVDNNTKLLAVLNPIKDVPPNDKRKKQKVEHENQFNIEINNILNEQITEKFISEELNVNNTKLLTVFNPVKDVPPNDKRKKQKVEHENQFNIEINNIVSQQITEKELSVNNTKLLTVLNPVKDVPPNDKRKKQKVEHENQFNIEINNIVNEQITEKELNVKEENGTKQAQSQRYQQSLFSTDMNRTDEVLSVEDKICRELYRKIPKKDNTKPEEIGVYDFFDEEEEAEKKRQLEEKEREKELRRCTCRFCDKVFEDPIEVLRHKRKFHKFARVLVSKEELAPHLVFKDRSECPICFKPLDKLIHKSVYLKHLMTHNIDYTFKCSICGIPFKRKDFLATHQKRHIVEPK